MINGNPYAKNIDKERYVEKYTHLHMIKVLFSDIIWFLDVKKDKRKQRDNFIMDLWNQMSSVI